MDNPNLELLLALQNKRFDGLSETEEEKYISLIAMLEQELEKVEKFDLITMHGTHLAVLNAYHETIEENKQLKERIETDFATIKSLTEEQEVYFQLAKEYKKKLDKIALCTLHAGCMGHPQCHLCPIQEIVDSKD